MDEARCRGGHRRPATCGIRV